MYKRTRKYARYVYLESAGATIRARSTARTWISLCVYYLFTEQYLSRVSRISEKEREGSRQEGWDGGREALYRRRINDVLSALV